MCFRAEDSLGARSRHPGSLLQLLPYSFFLLAFGKLNWLADWSVFRAVLVFGSCEENIRVWPVLLSYLLCFFVFWLVKVPEFWEFICFSCAKRVLKASWALQNTWAHFFVLSFKSRVLLHLHFLEILLKKNLFDLFRRFLAAKVWNFTLFSTDPGPLRWALPTLLPLKV